MFKLASVLFPEVSSVFHASLEIQFMPHRCKRSHWHTTISSLGDYSRAYHITYRPWPIYRCKGTSFPPGKT